MSKLIKYLYGYAKPKEAGLGCWRLMEVSSNDMRLP